MIEGMYTSRVVPSKYLIPGVDDLLFRDTHTLEVTEWNCKTFVDGMVDSTENRRRRKKSKTYDSGYDYAVLMRGHFNNGDIGVKSGTEDG